MTPSQALQTKDIAVAEGEVLDEGELLSESQIRKLHEDVWSRGRPHFPDRLTREEWASIQRSIKPNNLACMMVNCGMGFEIGMELYVGPVFPGTGSSRLLLLEGSMLPDSPADARGDKKWRWSFDTLSPFTHNQSNRELLKFLRLPEPREYQHYTY